MRISSISFFSTSLANTLRLYLHTLILVSLLICMRPRSSNIVERQYSVTYVDFETLLRTSDVISVNVPLNKQTTHLLGTREFAAMKDGAILVNTARGKVLNEDALVRALDAGKLLTVGLDVFEEVKTISLLLFVFIPMSTSFFFFSRLIRFTSSRYRNPRFTRASSRTHASSSCHTLVPTHARPSWRWNSWPSRTSSHAYPRDSY